VHCKGIAFYILSKEPPEEGMRLTTFNVRDLGGGTIPIGTRLKCYSCGKELSKRDIRFNLLRVLNPS